MSKMLVISERGRIRGIYTQKKKLWEIMGFEKIDLMVAKNAEKFTELHYNNMCKYLKERGILQLYDPDEITEGIDPETVKSKYIIWIIEPNTFYDPEIPGEEEDELKENCGGNCGENVHTQNCCKEHGCAFAEDTCPVLSGGMEQNGPCGECNFERENIGPNEKSREKFHI